MIIQGSDEWKLARLGKATASMFDIIMAGERFAGWKNYRAQLVVERLTSKFSEGFQSNEMLWGTETEPLARTYYSLLSGNKVDECGFFDHAKLAAGASPDGLIGDDGTLEIKSPNTATHLETLKSGQIPKKYYAQVQGQLWITGRQWADFVSFDPRLPEQARIIIINLQRDEQYIEQLAGEVGRFLEQVEQEVEFVKSYRQGVDKWQGHPKAAN